MSLVKINGTLNLDGSVTSNISVGDDGGGVLTGQSSDLNIVELTGGLPALMPISADPNGSGSWKDAFTWPLRFVLVSGPIRVHDLLSTGSPSDFEQAVSKDVDTLQRGGPTAESVGFSVDVPIFPGLTATVGLSFNITYDVTIPDQADITLDQPGTNVYDITIDQGGSLRVAIPDLALDTDLTNGGHLTIEADAGGVVGRDFVNDGLAVLDAPIAVQHEIRNDGTIEVHTTLTPPEILNGNGRVEAWAGGLIQISSDFTDGVLEARSGGTVQVGGRLIGSTVVADTGGTVQVNWLGSIINALLSGPGAFQSGPAVGTGFGDAYGSVLQGVSLAARTTFTALTGSLTALRGTIDNAGTLAAVANSTFTIDGGVTLTGGGQLVLGGGNSNLFSADIAHLYGRSTDPDVLTNVDNTISGAGFVYPGSSQQLLNFPGGGLQIVNQSAGIIDANISGEALILDATISNEGLIETTNGGTLQITASVDNTGGTVEALSGSTVEVDDEGTLDHGMVIADAGGTVRVNWLGMISDALLSGPGAFQGGPAVGSGFGDAYGSVLQGVSLAAGTTFTALTGSLTGLRGTITNAGTLAAVVNGTFAIDGGVTLTGGGQLVLGGDNSVIESADSAVLAGRSADPGVLTNVDNTISGTGQVYSATTLQLVNQSAGTINANVAGHALFLSGDVLNDGLMEATNNGTLEVAGDISGSGTIVVGGTVLLDGQVGAGLHVVFDPGTLVLGTPRAMHATIEGFALDDSIVLKGNYGNLTTSFSSNMLTVYSDGTSIADLSFGAGYTLADFSVTAGGGGVAISTDVTCFLAGTRILTSDGDVSVDTLQVGDRVLTVTPDGMVAKPIRWIGERRIDLASHPRPNRVWPVRIRRGAFGEGLPARDLMLSPDHAIWVDGVLIPARLLLNGGSIVQDETLAAVHYYHIELEHHAILLSNGLPTESYLDTGNRSLFANGGGPVVLHPDFSASADVKCWERDACAPLATDAARVEPAWQRLAERSGRIGFPVRHVATTDDPELRLQAEGRFLDPILTDGDRYVFALPARCQSVRLSSRSGSPADVRPWAEDRRRLGVCLDRIVLDDIGGGRTELPVDHPSLTEGWWGPERDDVRLWRWTDGDAKLRLPPGVAIIELRLGTRATYRLGEAAPERAREAVAA